MVDKELLSGLRRDLADLGNAMADCRARLEALEQQAELEAATEAAFMSRFELEGGEESPIVLPHEALPSAPQEIVPAVTEAIPDEPPSAPPPIPQKPLPVMSEIHLSTRPVARRQEPASQTPYTEIPLIDFGYWLRRLGPKEDMSWEMALGTYWLPRLGMLIVVIGIALGLSLAIQYLHGKWWLPHLRVAVGYLFCAAFLGIGLKLEAKAQNYARVLLAGGMALLYFVTYSTHYISYTKIIPWAPPVLLALAAICGLWFAVAQRRKSRLVAAGTTVLGHLTIFLSTWTLVRPHPTSVLGLMLLSLGSAVFLLRNRWYHVAALGMACSYANHTLWMSRCPPSDRVIDCLMALSVVMFYFFIFAVAEVKAPEALRRRAVRGAFRNGFVAFNSAMTLFLGTAILRNYLFSQDRVWLFYFAFAAVLLAFGEYYLRRLKDDPLHNVYFVKACAVGTLGLAEYFDGAMLTLALAVQAVTLLASARRSNLVVTRLLAWAVGALAFVHGLYSLQESLIYSEYYWSNALPSMLVVAAFVVLAIFYERTDWTPASLKRSRIWPDWHELLWYLDLLDEPPLAGLTRPMGGLLFPRLFAAGAVVLTVGYVVQFVPLSDRGAVLGVAALALFVSGVALSSRAAVEGGLSNAVAAYALWMFHGLERHQPWDTPGAYKNGILCAGILLAALFAMCEIARRWGTRPPIAWAIVRLKDGPAFGAISLGLGGWLGVTAMGTACLFLSVGDKAVTLGAMALCAAVYAAAVPAYGIGFASAILAFGAALVGAHDFPQVGQWMSMSLCAALVFGVALHSEPRFLGKRPGLVFHQLAPMPYAFYPAAFVPLAFFLANTLKAPYDALGLAAAAVIAMLLTLVLHPRALACCALGLLAWGACSWGSELGAWNYHRWHAAGFVLAGLALLGERFLFSRRIFPQPESDFSALLGGGGSEASQQDPNLDLRRWATFLPQVILMGIAWLVLLYQGGQAEPSPWTFFCYAVVNLYFLGYAGYFRVPVAGGYALVSAALSTFCLLGVSYTGQMMERNDPLPLIAAFLGAIVFWGVCERAWAYVQPLELLKDKPETEKQIQIGLVAIPSVLLMLMLERIPLLSDHYLTISWALGAVLLMGVSFLFRQPYFRYAGLLAFAPAVIRVAVWDTRHLHGIYRIAAWIVLGLILLAVGYGYVRARIYLRERKEPLALSGGADEVDAGDPAG